MSAPTSPLGVGLYFIDVFACVLFCLALALVGARFGRERTVVIEAPSPAREAAGASALTATSIAIRPGEDGTPSIWLEEEAIGVDELQERLREAAPPGIVVRSEESLLARVIAIAHASGVAEIELAYETRPPRAEEGRP